MPSSELRFRPVPRNDARIVDNLADADEAVADESITGPSDSRTRRKTQVSLV